MKKTFLTMMTNHIVEVTIQAYNQHGELVLTDITEAIVKNKL